MQLKPIAAIIVLSFMVASVLVSGCTVGVPGTSSPTPTVAPTVPTPTPVVDYSSIIAKDLEAGNSIVERPFTKSTNERGNDVYKGVSRNASLPGSHSVTLVYELTKSEAEAKQVYNKAVNEKINGGFTPDPDTASKIKANDPSITAVWVGTSGISVSICSYFYYYSVHGWVVELQSFALS